MIPTGSDINGAESTSFSLLVSSVPKSSSTGQGFHSGPSFAAASSEFSSIPVGRYAPFTAVAEIPQEQLTTFIGSRFRYVALVDNSRIIHQKSLAVATVLCTRYWSRALDGTF
jgi:hypothetical protein